MKPMNFPERKKQRRQDAKRRNTRWRKLTPEQKLAELDRRLGVGVGAAKQRAKLLKEIEAGPRTRKKKNKGRKNG